MLCRSSCYLSYSANKVARSSKSNLGAFNRFEFPQYGASCYSRNFHGLAVGIHSPARPETLHSCDMSELHFTNDFINHHTDYQGMVAYCANPINLNEDEMRPKAHSWVEATLPLRTNMFMRESMISFIGKKVRYGKLFEVIDAIAADVSYKHIGMDREVAKDVTIVTACVDGMVAKANVKAEEDLTVQAFMTYAGRSSMEIHVNLIQLDEIVVSTQFIMVAQKEGKSFQVPGLLVTSAEDQLEYEKGVARAARRKEKSASSLDLHPPRPDEVSIMHQMYLLEKKISQHNLLVTRGVATAADAPVGLPTKYHYMKESIVDSTYVMHPQQRNIHHKIFGGELMRISFEMAFICARCYAGTDKCHFYAIDDINFLKPVNIGAIMDFVGTVVYSNGRFIVIQVDVWELSGTNKGSRKAKTNQLTYIFEGQDDDGDGDATLPQVLPRSYEEMVLYVNGKRSFDNCFRERK